MRCLKLYFFHVSFNFVNIIENRFEKRSLGMKQFGKKLLLAGILVGLSGTAAASNPFTDVDRDSWSYQSVSQLADDGLVVGYPDGTFKGDKNITRYELAQIVARLRERDDLTEAQRADVSKLSKEYSEELENLGVRLSNLEKKASNTQVILEARFHYMPVYSNIFKGEDRKSVV